MFTHDIVTFVHYYIVSKYIVEISLKKKYILHGTFCVIGRRCLNLETYYLAKKDRAKIDKRINIYIFIFNNLFFNCVEMFYY